MYPVVGLHKGGKVIQPERFYTGEGEVAHACITVNNCTCYAGAASYGACTVQATLVLQADSTVPTDFWRLVVRLKNVCT